MTMLRDDRPECCEHCQQAERADGGWLEIQYSSAAQAWLCLRCHLERYLRERYTPEQYEREIKLAQQRLQDRLAPKVYQ